MSVWKGYTNHDHATTEPILEIDAFTANPSAPNLVGDENAG
jgi:hypothetical protein